MLFKGMNIDFHHAATYALARLGGLPHEAASIVATSAQYVDDATNSGLIEFDNGAVYGRISSAHKSLDYRNFERLADSHVWIPFHFIPGNLGLGAGAKEAESARFIDRLITLPDSEVAREMVRQAIRDHAAPWALHRLGITLHAYADTWAHQGFAGILHPINHASEIDGIEPERKQKLIEWFEHVVVNNASPLGHGAVLSNPDRPYLVWSYINGENKKVERDNPRDFLLAADALCRAVGRFVHGDPEFLAPGLTNADARAMDELFRANRGEEMERHAVWVKAIADGMFSFGKATIDYVAKGPGSWKHAALGTLAETDDGDEVFRFEPGFFVTHWKHFHDAAQMHRLDLLNRVLPKFGILAA